MDEKKNMIDEFVKNWDKRIEFTLKVFKAIGFIIPIISYYIISSYLAEIEFDADFTSVYIIFSIAVNLIFFFGIFFIIIMFGSFFSYNELSEHKNKAVLIKWWWSSSLILIVFYLSYFGGAYLLNLGKFQTLFWLISLMVGLGLIEYFIAKKVFNSKDFTIIFWQMFSSFLVVGCLLILLINTHIGISDLFFIILASLILHSYPYIFVLFSPKSWGKYIFVSIIVFLLVLFMASPDSLKYASIKGAHIGGIYYESIIIKDEACVEINKYSANKPCEKNTLTNVTGLWLLGDTHLFKNENEEFKIKADNIWSKKKKIP